MQGGLCPLHKERKKKMKNKYKYGLLFIGLALFVGVVFVALGETDITASAFFACIGLSCFFIKGDI